MRSVFEKYWSKKVCFFFFWGVEPNIIQTFPLVFRFFSFLSFFFFGEFMGTDPNIIYDFPACCFLVRVKLVQYVKAEREKVQESKNSDMTV